MRGYKSKAGATLKKLPHHADHYIIWGTLQLGCKKIKLLRKGMLGYPLAKTNFMSPNIDWSSCDFTLSKSTPRAKSPSLALLNNE